MGYGGGLPEGFTEDGRFVIEEVDAALFVADGGAEIPFEVAPDPMPKHSCR